MHVSTRYTASTAMHQLSNRTTPHTSNWSTPHWLHSTGANSSHMHSSQLPHRAPGSCHQHCQALHKHCPFFPHPTMVSQTWPHASSQAWDLQQVGGTYTAPPWRRMMAVNPCQRWSGLYMTHMCTPAGHLVCVAAGDLGPGNWGRG